MRTPLYESLFTMSHNLCKEYPALSPFAVDDMGYGDVVDLYVDVRRLQISQKKEMENNSGRKKNKGKDIYIPAGDDWY